MDTHKFTRTSEYWKIAKDWSITEMQIKNSLYMNPLTQNIPTIIIANSYFKHLTYSVLTKLLSCGMKWMTELAYTRNSNPKTKTQVLKAIDSNKLHIHKNSKPQFLHCRMWLTTLDKQTEKPSKLKLTHYLLLIPTFHSTQVKELSSKTPKLHGIF